MDSVFSPGEQRHASGLRERYRFEFLAGRFAVKEAVLKAADSVDL
jgi:phosphopantetheine--protein transferase-like protein